MEFSSFFLRGLGFIVGGAIFWMLYFDLKDYLRPEPRRLLLVAFLLGCFAAGLSLGAYRIVELLGLPVSPGGTAAAIMVFCVGIVGPIEEGSKFFVARAFVFRWHEFDEPIDGMVYASAVAIGFASVENFLYMPHLTGLEQAARAAASPLTHSLFAALWGLGVSRAMFMERSRASRWLWQAGTLALAAALHGLYDFFIFAYNTGYVSSLITLALWLILMRYARNLVRTPGRKASAEAVQSV